MTIENPLAGIVGRCMSSIEFFKKHVCLKFDGINLTAFVPPRVYSGKCAFSSGDPEYRDALVSIVRQDVETVELTKRAIQIGFANQSQIVLPLTRQDTPGATSGSVYFEDDEKKYPAQWL